jgi:GAF domain-containing protein
VPTGLIQLTLTSPAVIAVVAAVLVIAIIVALLLWQRAGQKKREKQARERLQQMEQEARFASAVDGLKHSRKANDVASDIAALLREHLSFPVLATFAGRETNSRLLDVLQSSSRLPDSVPSTLLEECAVPVVEKLAMLTTYQGSDSSGFQEPSPQPALEEIEVENAEDVLLVPWRGPFNWKGLIVASTPAAVPAETLERYREPLARLTDRLAVALELERTDAELLATEKIARRTAEFSRSLIGCLEAASPLDEMLKEVASYAGSDSAALWRVDEPPSMVKITASHGLKSAEFLPLPLGQGLAGSVAQTGEVLALEDAPADPRCIFPREARESGILSYLGAPLSANGNLLGVLEVHFASSHSWSESDRRAIESAASIVADLLRIIDSSGNRLKVESAYLGLSEALQRLRSAEELKEAVVEVLGHALGASRVIVVEFNEQGQPEPVKQEYRDPTRKSALGAAFAESLAARVQASKGSQTIAIADSREDSLMGRETAEELGVRSELAIPIRLDGKARAAVYVHQCDNAREWEPDEIEFTERVVNQLSLSLSNLRLLDLAFSDVQQARAAARQAEQSAKRVETMLSGLPEMVLGVDREGRLTFFNSPAGDRLGLSTGDLGQTFEKLEALTTDGESAWEKIVDAQAVTRFDGKIKPRGGNGEVPVGVSVAPLRDESGEVNSRVVVVTDVSQLQSVGNASARIQELERRLEDLDNQLAGSRSGEKKALEMYTKASALEASARAEADAARRREAEARSELESVLQERNQAQGSAQQLLEINRLKSEFIVNAGHEIEASLQSALGLSELLDRGAFGELTQQQKETVQAIYGWARRMKNDVDWLIEYGSTRSRRLESSGAEQR